MNKVRPKKWLGQHFLHDQSTAAKIAGAISLQGCEVLMEIGPGTGVLTRLLAHREIDYYAIEIDDESVEYLKAHHLMAEDKIVHADFIKSDLTHLFVRPLGVIGNFPYNISSQIFFKLLDHRTEVMEIVCMLQREVAERIASPPGNKRYGILSVLLQTYYQVQILFHVAPGAFHPPPKVYSSVIRLVRHKQLPADCPYQHLRRVVKQAFQNRRKTLRNALKNLNFSPPVPEELMSKRAEQLSPQQFITLAKHLD